MSSKPLIKLGLPKGRMCDDVLALLRECGLRVQQDARSYRPWVSDPDISAKFLKPQIIPQLVEMGSLDAGFTGYDMLVERGNDVLELTDTGLNPVSIVAACPEGYQAAGKLSGTVVVASEYDNVARGWLDKQPYKYKLIQSHGATEVFPPEDADMIIDNTATGQTLAANHLEVIATILKSSTRFIANKSSYANPDIASRLNDLDMLMRATIEGRKRVILEMNVTADKLDALVAVLPAMKSPTVQKLFGSDGYAVKVAILEKDIMKIIPRAKDAGATDIIEYDLKKVVQ